MCSWFILFNKNYQSKAAISNVNCWKNERKPIEANLHKLTSMHPVEQRKNTPLPKHKTLIGGAGVGIGMLWGGGIPLNDNRDFLKF